MRPMRCRSLGPALALHLTIQNVGAVAAYRDLRYATVYREASGKEVRTGKGRIYEVIQPGETRTLRAFNEGSIAARATSDELRLVGAEKLVPTRR